MMYTPPSYCPNAVATDNGWVNPKNGELLVAIKNLSTKIRDHNSNTIVGNTPQVVIVDEIATETLQPVENVVVDDVTMVGPTNHVISVDDAIDVEEEIPSKKRPGRPKKLKQ